MFKPKILTSILFLKKMSDITAVRSWDKDESKKQIPSGVVVYEINGPMFFAATDKFLEIPKNSDIRVMILRASNMPILDCTAVKNIENLFKECKRYGIKLIISHINKQPLEIMKRNGLYDIIGEENFCPNIDMAISRANELL